MIFAFVLTLIAGLATILGGIIGVHKSTQKPGMLSVMLGLAVGAMVSVSILDLLPAAFDALYDFELYERLTLIVLFVAAGALFTHMISGLIPCSNRAECTDTNNSQCLLHDTALQTIRNNRLLRNGIVVCIVMVIHNLPEGIVTFYGAMHDVALGASLAFAIALHNIPEGIAIASPIYAATKNKIIAIKYAAVSGLAEPVGGFLGYLLLVRTIPKSLLGLVFAATAGMMLYISMRELVPAARAHSNRRREPIIGASAGLGIISISLLAINTL